jgi:large subunit ribosomal protein L5
MTVPTLKQFYLEKVVPEMAKARGFKNPHQVPTINKIVLNSRIDSEADKNWVTEVVKDITLISGQKPVITRARTSVANFKVREGMPSAVMVTLRGPKMWDFLLRLLSVTLPNIRDFRGMGRKFDGRGSYNLGIADHTIFPEITVDPGRKNIGLDIAIVTTARTDDDGRELLRLLGMPFRTASAPTVKKPDPNAPAPAAEAAATSAPAAPAPVPA